MKHIFLLSVCIISRLVGMPSRLGPVPPVQFTIDMTDTLSYLTTLIASIFG